MALNFSVVVDCTDPHRLAAFWASATGYLLEDHSRLVEQLIEAGAISEDQTVLVDGRREFAVYAGVRHPDDPYDERSDAGRGRRILFQKVPEPKSVKNRVHLDLHVGKDGREAETERLIAAGATLVGTVDEGGQSWTTLADPEGNEFDLV